MKPQQAVTFVDHATEELNGLDELVSCGRGVRVV